jgi:hypothetical protein
MTIVLHAIQRHRMKSKVCFQGIQTWRSIWICVLLKIKLPQVPILWLKQQNHNFKSSLFFKIKKD